MKNINYLNLKDINAPYQSAICQALAEVVDSGWYLRGERVQRFEQQWADYCDARYCASCGSGLDALRLVLMAWRRMGLLNEGDEVIVPANTFIATVLAVSESGLTPVLVDPDPETYLLSCTGIERVVSEKTKAVVPVHLYGQQCDMPAIDRLASRLGLLVLEDCAQCHGINHLTKTKRHSTIATERHACAWSFYPGKNLGALGDAGAVTTDSKTLAETVRALANYGSAEKYVHDHKGINSRMDEFQAAVLSAKLPDLQRCNSRRIEIAQRYLQEIDNRLIVLPKVRTESVFHIFAIRCEQRDRLKDYLAGQGIQTQIHYPIPIHRQGAYREELGKMALPVTEKIAQTELSLPCNQAMTDEEVAQVITAVNGYRQ